MHGSSIQDSKHASQIAAKISSFVASLLVLALGLSAHASTVQETLDKMTVEEKVGQVMIWGFIGTSYDSQLDEMLTRYQPGALIFFRRNIKSHRQVARLNSEIMKASAKKLKAPLFLMVDQEGGVVTRIRINTPIPSALALGKVGSAAYIENYGKTTGDLLYGLGFNFNLAPVMDISSPGERSFIGNRSFGHEPASVTDFAMAYSRGLSRAGVAPTAKHFPGHGGTISDSHKMTPQKLSTPEELETRDLLPFQKFADATFPRAIMSAHLTVPKIDPLGIPATYSPLILRDRLRDDLGFPGLVLTDDLEMSGADITPDLGERAVRAFIAGNDMVMIAGSHANQRRAFKSMLTALKEGRISEARLNESVVRVLETKKQMNLAEAKVDAAKADAATRRLERLSKDIMRRNFKMALGAKAARWPEIKYETATTVFSSSASFSYHFRKAFRGQTRHYPLTPKTLNGVKSELSNENLKFAVFYASGLRTARWLKQLPPELKEKLIVVNCNESEEVEDQELFLTVLNLNSHSPDSGAWLADALSEPRPQPAPEVMPPADLRTPASETEPVSDDL